MGTAIKWLSISLVIVLMQVGLFYLFAPQLVTEVAQFVAVFR